MMSNTQGTRLTLPPQVGQSVTSALDRRRDIRAAVHRLVTRRLAAASCYGPPPQLGSAAWHAAPEAVQLATVLVLAEAWLVRDDAIEVEVASRCKQVAGAFSAMDWRAEAEHAAAGRRRAEPGPITPPPDPAHVDRWVETGSSSREGEAAA